MRDKSSFTTSTEAISSSCYMPWTGVVAPIVEPDIIFFIVIEARLYRHREKQLYSHLSVDLKIRC
jgi:hypothetical protein